ncbi:HlyD family secretion protein [Flavobacterium sp. WG21]|uniref:HlyD family secretion protein n=1 Tax=Flavobacterium sp. WG21 TaxID=1229487 RepID=UPI000346941C|nr:HlyD family efflux transporter periplasmic adaptor subunit [Flavobacterium sp. WG21]
MEELKDGLKVYSEEVRDVLTNPPSSILRWGNSILLGFIFILLVISWIIKYPDIVSTQIVITTNIPPQKIVAKSSGKIEVILVKDRSFVNEDTPLAIIQNSSNYKDVYLLENEIIKHPKGDFFDFTKLENLQLGEIESSYSLFQAAYIAYELNADLKPFQIEREAQNEENRQILLRINLLIQKKKLNENELKLQKKDFNRYEELFNKGIISAQDFDNKKLGYIQVEKGYRDLLSSISQLESSLNDNSKNGKSAKISGTKEEVNLKNNKIQAFYQLKKVIKDWELAFVLKSSVTGKVSFLQIWTTNQTINSGETIFSVIPFLEKGYVGKLKAPAQNSGKLKVGEKVNIKLTNFPDNQYGILVGKIKSISLTPDKDGSLWIDVALPKKLETSYHKIIPFQQEMSGTAEIITEDLRLIERFLYQFRTVFKR